MKTCLLIVFLFAAFAKEASADWKRVERGYFVFFFHPENEPKVIPLIKKAGGYRERILSMLSLKDDSKIEVYVAADEEEMGAILGGAMVSEWVAGLAISSQNRVILSAKGSALFAIEDTLIHELAHIYLSKKVGNGKLPRWFNEGFAMLLAGEPVIERLKMALRATVFKNLFRLEELAESFPSHEPGIHLAYAQSLLFMRHLVSRFSLKKVVEVIENMEELDLEAAFFKATGEKIGEIEREWLDGLEKSSTIFNIFSDWNVVWLGMTILLITAFLVKKSRTRKKVRMWELQEELEIARRRGGDELLN